MLPWAASDRLEVLSGGAAKICDHTRITPSTLLFLAIATHPSYSKHSTQLAFILNYHQHWFTLRRFGPAMPSMADDPGDGHWFNLNSFLPAPEWVGKLYLGMVLQQAESEGAPNMFNMLRYY